MLHPMLANSVQNISHLRSTEIGITGKSNSALNLPVSKRDWSKRTFLWPEATIWSLISPSNLSGPEIPRVLGPDCIRVRLTRSYSCFFGACPLAVPRCHCFLSAIHRTQAQTYRLHQLFDVQQRRVVEQLRVFYSPISHRGLGLRCRAPIQNGLESWGPCRILWSERMPNASRVQGRQRLDLRFPFAVVCR